MDDSRRQKISKFSLWLTIGIMIILLYMALSAIFGDDDKKVATKNNVTNEQINNEQIGAQQPAMFQNMFVYGNPYNAKKSGFTNCVVENVDFKCTKENAELYGIKAMKAYVTLGHKSNSLNKEKPEIKDPNNTYYSGIYFQFKPVSFDDYKNENCNAPSDNFYFCAKNQGADLPSLTKKLLADNWVGRRDNNNVVYYKIDTPLSISIENSINEPAKVTITQEDIKYTNGVIDAIKRNAEIEQQVIDNNAKFIQEMAK